MMVVDDHNATSGDSGDQAFYNLLPALLQCFIIILFGYLSGRTGIVHHGQGKGLAVFVSKFAMPAMLFKSMCELHFGDVNWRFLAAILIAKSAVFVAVLLVTTLLNRPTDFGKMGIYGIFTTQSHDFALGIPIVQALYQSTHPSYENYLYLIAPISVAFLNPIGFIMMATQNWRSTSPDGRRSMTSAICRILADVLSNPVVFMTLLGIICNFIFHQKVPTYLDDILVVLKNAFPATALFCLGHSMVGKRTSERQYSAIVLFLLIAAKMVMSPLLIRELVTALANGNNQTANADLSGYGFLYGMFPTAPSVFIYASNYGFETDLVATGMVISTFVAAPLMFVSGKMLMMPVSDKRNWLSLIHKASFDVGIVNLVCLIWVLAVFYINRRIRNLPHQFTALLGISQAMMSVGIILLASLPESSSTKWQQCLQFLLFYTGLLSTRCWMAVIAVALCILKVRSFCALYAWRPYMVFYAIGIPVIVSGILLASTPGSRLENMDASYLYGSVQRVVMLCALSVNMILAVAALIRSHRYELGQLVSKNSLLEETEEEGPRPMNTPALLINGTGSFLTQGPNNRYTSPMSICHSAPSRFACFKQRNCRTAVPSPMLAGIQQQMGDEEGEDGEWKKLKNEDSDEEQAPQLRIRHRPRQDSDDINHHKLAVENSMRKRQDTEDLAKLVERWGLENSRRDSEDDFLKPDHALLNRQTSDDPDRGDRLITRKDSADVIGRGMRSSRNNSDVDFKGFITEDGNAKTQKNDNDEVKSKRRQRRAAQREVQIEINEPEVNEVEDKRFYIGNKPVIVSGENHNEIEDQLNKELKIVTDIEDLGQNVTRQLAVKRKRAQSGPADRVPVRDELRNGCGDCELHDGNPCCNTDTATERTPLLQNNVNSRMSPEICPGVADTFCQSQEGCVIAKNFRETTDASSEDELLILQDQDFVQHSRHLVLVLLLLVSAFVSFCLNIWTLMSERISSVYVEVEFLDCVLSYGQGFFVFAVFGIDQNLIIEPLAKRWRDWFTGHAEIVLPTLNELSEETRRICEQFQMYHLVQCQEVIVTDRRERLKLYKDVFLGTHLVDWLLQVGLASDRAASVQYGRHLLAGRVIEHIVKKHHFQDLPYFYRFCENNEDRVEYEQLP